MKKLFILDTNVLLHDPSSVFNFEDNDLMIPIIVLEELDRFKKGTDLVNQCARSFIRTLSKLSDANPKAPKIPLGEGRGNIIIKIDGYETDSTSPIFQSESVDNRLLALALNVRRELESEYEKVVFVTKDINLRMKARALAIDSEDYENDKIEDLSRLYSGYRTIENCDSALIDELFANPAGVQYEYFSEYIPNPIANEQFLLKADKQSGLAYYNPITKTIEKVLDQEVMGIRPKNLEQKFAINLLLNKEVPLVALTGISGTGKTLLSLAAAVAQRKSYLQVFLARPIVPVGRDIGYLPGDWKEKVDPYMQPLWDNLEVIKKESKQKDKIEELVTNEKIRILALPYLRGRSLPRIFFIIDEAQNLTPHEVKTIITRAGEGAKVVFTGDINQIDSPYLDARSNGLSYLISKMKGQELFGHVRLTKGERSKLAELASNIL